LALEREIRRLKQQRRKERQSLTPHAVQSVLAVYVLSDRNIGLACLLYEQLRQQLPSKRQAQAPSLEERQRQIEDWYLAQSATRLASFSVPESDADKRFHAKATKWLAEHAAAAFIRGQNALGVAPASSAVAEHYCQQLPPASEEDGEPATVLPSTRRGRVKWMQRFRARWHAKLGRLQEAKDMPAEVIADKAPARGGGPQIGSQLGSPNLGP